MSELTPEREAEIRDWLNHKGQISWVGDPLEDAFRDVMLAYNASQERIAELVAESEARRKLLMLMTERAEGLVAEVAYWKSYEGARVEQIRALEAKVTALRDALTYLKFATEGYTQGLAAKLKAAAALAATEPGPASEVGE